MKLIHTKTLPAPKCMVEISKRCISVVKITNNVSVCFSSTSAFSPFLSSIFITVY